MEKRNRHGGRIDRIKDSSEKLSTLEKQKIFFDIILKELEIELGTELLCLNMENSTEAICRELLAKMI